MQSAFRPRLRFGALGREDRLLRCPAVLTEELREAGRDRHPSVLVALGAVDDQLALAPAHIPPGRPLHLVAAEAGESAEGDPEHVALTVGVRSSSCEKLLGLQGGEVLRLGGVLRPGLQGADEVRTRVAALAPS